MPAARRYLEDTMSHPSLTMTPEATRRLIERLSKVKVIGALDQPGEPQATTLAHSLSDLEQSFREFLDVLLPRLLDESLTPDQMADVMHDIREELRHVLYHIKDPRYFGDLLYSSGESLQEET
jgi:hypothetical protein